MSRPLDLRTEVHVRADRLSVVYRRLLASMIGEGAASPSAASPSTVEVTVP